MAALQGLLHHNQRRLRRLTGSDFLHRREYAEQERRQELVEATIDRRAVDGARYAQHALARDADAVGSALDAGGHADLSPDGRYVEDAYAG